METTDSAGLRCATAPPSLHFAQQDTLTND